MDFLNQYIVLLVVNICLCVGYIIKHSITFIPNKYIPLIMAVLGTIINIWISGWQFSPEILLGGLVSGLASTGTYEMIRNLNRNNSQAGSNNQTGGNNETGGSNQPEDNNQNNNDTKQ